MDGSELGTDAGDTTLLSSPPPQHSQEDVVVIDIIENVDSESHPFLSPPAATSRLDWTVARDESQQSSSLVRATDRIDPATEKQASKVDSGLWKNSSCAPRRESEATTLAAAGDVGSDVGLHAHAPQAADRTVHFRVGQERQPMVGRESELAAMSPVFGAMFCARWSEGGEEGIHVDIPDLGTKAFAVILR